MRQKTPNPYQLVLNIAQHSDFNLSQEQQVPQELDIQGSSFEIGRHQYMQNPGDRGKRDEILASEILRGPDALKLKWHRMKDYERIDQI